MYSSAQFSGLDALVGGVACPNIILGQALASGCDPVALSPLISCCIICKCHKMEKDDQ